MKKLVFLILVVALASIVGCGGGSSKSSTTPTPTVTTPTAPTALTAAAASGQVTVSWTAVSGATSYNVYYATSAGVTVATGTKVSVTTGTTYTLTSATSGATYYFLVTAVNSAGESTTATANATLSPAAPTALVATAGNAQVALSWTAANGATSYNVYYGTSSSLTTATGTKISTTTASATVASLTNNTKYYFIVTALNSAGASAASTQASATPLPAIAGVPTGLTAVAADAQVALSWTAVTGATSYNVYYGTSSSLTTANGTKLNNTSTSKIVTGLTNGTKYYFIVTTVDLGGESAASAAVSATPVSPTGAPTLSSATAGNAQVALSWTTVTGATSYNVYYGTTSGVTTVSGTKFPAGTSTTATVTGLTNTTLYYFVVTSVDAGGESAVSNQLSATPTTGVTIALTPGADASTPAGVGSLSNPIPLTFTFPYNAVTAPATATITPIAQANLPAPLTKKTRANGRFTPMVTGTDTFVASFNIAVNPSANFAGSVPVVINGSDSLGGGTTLNLAMLQGSTWVDVATFVVGIADGTSFTENLPSYTLPGLLAPGTYLVYVPTLGTNTSVSNLGLALTGDGASQTGDAGVQMLNLYDASGNLLSTPVLTPITYSSLPTVFSMNALGLTPDASMGILAPNYGDVLVFAGVETGSPYSSTTPVALNASYGATANSVAMLPTGDVAIVSANAPSAVTTPVVLVPSNLAVVSGILSGSPSVTGSIPVIDSRDAVVTSNDGSVLLARGTTGLTVFSYTPSGTSLYTQVTDFSDLGSAESIDTGRAGMAISPVDPSTAIVVTPGGTATENCSVQVLTGLTSTPVMGQNTSLYTTSCTPNPFTVAISPDGTLAVVGGTGGLMLFSGVNTGTLTPVAVYDPTYILNDGVTSVSIGTVSSVAITLDGKYVVASVSVDSASVTQELVVIPFSSTGFGPVASVYGGGGNFINIPDNDQLIVH
jgi:fibronectin type 3 domain-containing protein